MKKEVIFLIFLVVSMPFSYAKTLEVPGVGENGDSAPLRDEFGVKKFIYAGDEIVASVENSTGEPTIKYYHSGRLSNRLTTGDIESDMRRFKSLPFGQKIENSGLEEIDYPFTGKEEDESSLYYFGARYYDGNLGRFISVDPVEENHAYSYVENNPMNKIDPNGRESWTLNQQNIFEEPPGWVSEKFGDVMYNSLWGEVRDFNVEVNFYSLPSDGYGFSNSGTGEAWVDFGGGNLVSGMGFHTFSDFDLRRMVGEVGYLEELIHQAPAIAVSLAFSYFLLAGSSSVGARAGGKSPNFDLSKANRQSGSWLKGDCPNRVLPCENARCTDQAMHSGEILANSGGYSPQAQYASRHAQKIATECFESGVNCPLAGSLDEALSVLKQLETQSYQQQLVLPAIVENVEF